MSLSKEQLWEHLTLSVIEETCYNCKHRNAPGFAGGVVCLKQFEDDDEENCVNMKQPVGYPRADDGEYHWVYRGDNRKGTWPASD